MIVFLLAISNGVDASVDIRALSICLWLKKQVDIRHAFYPEERFFRSCQLVVLSVSCCGSRRH